MSPANQDPMAIGLEALSFHENVGCYWLTKFKGIRRKISCLL